MGKFEKLINRLKTKPADFTYNEVRRVLFHLGYVEKNKGKTSGSRVRFVREDINSSIDMHKPHPGNILKEKQLEKIVLELMNKRLI